MGYNGAAQVLAGFVAAQALGTSSSKVQDREECRAPGLRSRTPLAFARPCHGLSVIPPARTSSLAPRPESRSEENTG